MRGWLCIAVFLFAIGCGPNGPIGGAQDSPTPSPAATPDPTPDPQQPINMTGVWAARFVTSQTFTTDVADPTSSTLTTLARVSVDHNEGAMSTTLEICNLDLAPLGDTPTIITWPEATISSVNVMSATATIDSEFEGANFSGRVVVLVAWMPDGDPATEAIPVDAADVRVYDADGDNEVGSTLLVDSTINGEVYGVARTVVDLAGKVSNQQKVAGQSNTNLEINILDASSGFLEIEMSAVQDTVEPSDFVLVRMGETGNACGDITAGAEELF